MLIIILKIITESLEKELAEKFSEIKILQEKISNMSIQLKLNEIYASQEIEGESHLCYMLINFLF